MRVMSNDIKSVLFEEDFRAKKNSLQSLLEYQDFIQLDIKAEPPKLGRSCRKLCSCCGSSTVWTASFEKCLYCTRGEDATRNWREFKTYADFKPAHVSNNAIIYALNRLQTRRAAQQILTNNQYIKEKLIPLAIEYI